MVKLTALKSIANNAVRPSNWSTGEVPFDPFEHIRPRGTFIVDLITMTVTWITEDGEEKLVTGDDVEKYYKAIAEWFHLALKKEKIPLELIESAIIKITPNEKQCTIFASGKTFNSMKIVMSS